MALDIDAFRAAAQRMQHRTADVPVPELAALLPDADPATLVITVRGLSHHEMARAHEAADSGALDRIRQLVAALAEKSGVQVVAGEIAGALGRGGDTPADTARRLEMLVCGAVAPAIDIEAAVQIAEGFPFVLGKLTGKIIELTEGGATLGKPLRCTETAAS